jgi:hypothetical protein
MATSDVFISYKREERARVERVAQKLKAIGLRVWFDTRLEAGTAFDEQIASALKSAKAVLVCWTPGAMASEWVRAEAAMAHASARLVAAFFEPTELMPPFNVLHAEDLSDWKGEDDHAGWAKVLTRLAALSDDRKLQAWAGLMSEGEPGALRRWIAENPPGPLRSVARFWLSEGEAAPIAGIATPKRSRTYLWLVTTLAAVALAVAGGSYLLRPSGGDAELVADTVGAAAESAPGEGPPAPPPRVESGVISNAAECDEIDYRIEPGVVAEDRVMLVLAQGGGITWWKAIHLPLAEGGAADLAVQDGASAERTFLLSDLNLAGAMGFSKAKFLGQHVRLGYTWSGLRDIRGGDRIVFTWRRDGC